MKIQLKRSNQLESGSAKEPSVSQMEYGELAVNYNTADPSLFIKDSADQIVKLKIAEGAQVLISDTIPSTTENEPGTLWWNSSADSGQLFILYEDPSGGGGGDAGGPKWIEASPTTGGPGGGGAEVLVGPAAPVVDDLDEGSLWWNSSSDDLQLYVLYNDSGNKKWVEASPTGSSDSGSEDGFVKTEGDNMTGALTIGPDGGPAVTTLAADGSAEFAGTATFGDYDPSSTTTNGVINSAVGILTVQRNSDAGTNSDIFTVFQQDNRIARLGTDADFVLGGNIEGAVASWTPNIALNGSDGSAEFAGGSITLDADGNVTSANQILSRHLITNDGSFKLQYGGSDRVVMTSLGTTFYKNTAYDDEVITIGNNNGEDNIVLNGGGSANFAKSVNAGNWDGVGGTGVGVSVSYAGGLFARRDSSVSDAGTKQLFGGWLGTTKTVDITADGSADFAGTVEVKNINIQHLTGSTGSDKSLVINSASGSNRVQMFANGDARFVGTITTQGGAGGPYVTIGQTITFNTEPDNPANYVSTTDADGNTTQVYNGPTLDVKDRLQNLISRLDALESDEIADDATSTLLLTTVNNINAQMTKVNNALTAIRAAANTAGTLDQLKADIAAATADI